MNAGIISILLHQCPYQFRGIGVLSTIMFIVDLVLFIVFSSFFIARLVLFRPEAYHEIVGNIAELTLVACWSIAWLTLVSLVSLVVSQAKWGGHAFTIVAYVMWWIGVVWNFGGLFWVFISLIRRHDASDRRLPLTIILPAVSVSTLAVVGGLVASDSHLISARLAVPVIVVSFMSVGTGFFLGFILCTYLFHQMLAQGWPPPEQTASVFIFVGPSCQSAAALQLLGSAAQTYGKFAGYDKGSFLTAESAAALEAACVMLALMMFGLGVVWSIFAIYTMVERAVQRNLPWSPTWNAIIFPMGTMTTSTTLFAIEMDSPAFRVITAGLLTLLVLFFFINLFFVILRISQGRLLIVREDPRVKQRLQAEQKER